MKSTQDLVMEVYKGMKVPGRFDHMYPWLDEAQVKRELGINVSDADTWAALKALKAQGKLEDRVNSVLTAQGRVKTTYYRPVEGAFKVTEAPMGA